MISFFKKIIKQDPLSKIYVQYNKIVELESKRLKLKEEFPDIDTETQKSILLNDLKMLGKLYESQGDIKIIKNKEGLSYFNIQGTSTNIIYSHLPSINKHKETNSSTRIRLLDKDISNNRHIHNDCKFMKLNCFNNKVNEKIKLKAMNNIKSIVENYSSSFGDNSELVKDFILRHNTINSIEKRFLFIINLNLFNFDINISNKDIIEINSNSFNLSIKDIEEFIKEFKQYKYDFKI